MISSPPGKWQPVRQVSGSPGWNTSYSQLCVLTFFLPIEIRGGLSVLLLHILPFIKESVSTLSIYAFRWLCMVSVSQDEDLCKSLPGAVCLASSRGRGGQLPHVPSRGSPSMPKIQEGTPVLVKEGVLSQLDFDRSSPRPQPSSRTD